MLGVSGYPFSPNVSFDDLWFVYLLQKLDHEMWIGDAAQIRASYVLVWRQAADGRDQQTGKPTAPIPSG